MTKDAQGIRQSFSVLYDSVLCLFRSVKATKTKTCFRSRITNGMLCATLLLNLALSLILDKEVHFWDAFHLFHTGCNIYLLKKHLGRDHLYDD